LVMVTTIGKFTIHNYDAVKPWHWSISRRQNHLLVGNGFSSSLLKNVFSYSALRGQLDPARFTIGARIQNMFDLIGSDDFEETIRTLSSAEPIAAEYGLGAGPMSNDSKALKTELINAVGSTHPNHPLDGITDANYVACGAFLKKFKSIYTLNYDLLLYWVIIRANLTSSFRDGFTRIRGGLPLVWNGQRQNLFHLHGGLHIHKIAWNLEASKDYEAISDYDYIKLDNVERDNNLVDQIQEKLNQEIYPVTVAEGDSVSKKQRIIGERILRQSYLNFKRLNGALYTFGVGLDKNQDDHLIEAIESSDLSDVLLGVYQPTHQILTAIDAKFSQLNFQRGQNRLSSIRVRYYDTASLSIWA
jgi:hypothetical protein